MNNYFEATVLFFPQNSLIYCLKINYVQEFLKLSRIIWSGLNIESFFAIYCMKVY